MKTKIYILLMLLVLAAPGVSASDSNHLGFSVSFNPKHEYHVYFSDGRGKQTGMRDATAFSEFDINASYLFKKNLEFNAFARKLRVENVFIEGGLWNMKKFMLGFSGGIRHSIELHYRVKKEKKEDRYEFPLDFSAGFYLMGNFSDTQYGFVSGTMNKNVNKKGVRIGLGLYVSVQLRLKFMMDKLGLFFYPAVGFKYFAPFNDFEYSIDSNASYRLRRQFFYAGIYFRI